MSNKGKSRKKEKTPIEITGKIQNYLILISFIVIWIGLFSSFLFSGDMIMGTDMYQNGHFDRGYLATALKNGTFPLWDMHLHGGMPFLEGMHGVVFYPTTLLNLILPLPYALSFAMVLHVLLAGFFTYFCLREFGLSRIPSFFGGLSYMFAPFFVSLLYAGQDGKMFVIALFPLAMLTLLRALRGERIFDYLVFGFVYFLMVISPHMQLAYFSSWALGGYFIFVQIRRFINKERTLKHILGQTGAFLLGVAIFIGVSAPQILPPTDYLANYSQRLQQQGEERGYEYSTSWSLHWGELFSLLNHEYVGTSVGKQSYWSRNPFKLNSDYAGILPILLGIFALIFSRRKEKWFFLGVAIFAAIFALGANTPFYRLFYALIPQVDKFRAPAMIIFLLGFSFVTLAAMGLELLVVKDKRDHLDTKSFNLFLIVSAGVVLLGAIAISAGGTNLMTVLGPTDGNKAIAMQTAAKAATGAAWANLFMIYVTLGIMFLLKKSRIHPAMAVAILSIIVIVDLWRVNKPYINVVNPDLYYAKTPVVDELLRRQEKEGPFRVFIMPKTFNMDDTYLAQFGIDEVTFSALHGNQLIWYDQFVGRLKREPHLANPNFWDILNIKYITSRQRLPLEWEARLKPVGQIGSTILYENRNAFDRAVLFEDWEIVEDSTRILNRLLTDRLDYRNKVYLLEDPGIEKTSDSLLQKRTAVVKNWKNINNYNVSVDAPNGGVLFISESYYPHWKCYENGNELPILKANFAFRGIPLEPGTHELEFRFQNPLIKKSLIISLISFFLAIGLGGVSLIISRKRAS